MCSQAVTGLKPVWVELGQNITVNCDLADTKIYWYKHTPRSAPVPILCSKCDKERPKYYNTHLKQTFSLLANLSLMIQNITEDGLGDYYCVKDAEPHFTTGTRLETLEHWNTTSECLRYGECLHVLIGHECANVVTRI